MTRIIADKHTSNAPRKQTRHDKTIQGKTFRKENRKIETRHLILNERSLVLKMWADEMPGAL
jgi:hypothetical protein